MPPGEGSEDHAESLPHLEGRLDPLRPEAEYDEARERAHDELDATVPEQQHEVLRVVEARETRDESRRGPKHWPTRMGWHTLRADIVAKPQSAEAATALRR